MELRELFKDVSIIGNPPDKGAVTGLTCVSGETGPETAFFAFPGEKRDGHEFIPQALARGCRVVVAEKAMGAVAGTTLVRVADGRTAMALCAGNLYGHPSRQLQLAGVTGTSGKTTVTWLLDSILRGASGKSTLLGSIRHVVAGRAVDSLNTTPESYDINAYLREAIEQGSRHAVMEVSSHSLKLKRVHGLAFSAAVFTNLTRDHLDFHKTEADYLGSKMLLFSTCLKKGGMGAVNLDDPHSRDFMEACSGDVLTFGMDNSDADVTPEMVENRRDGMSLELRTPLGPLSLSTRLKGPFNVSNIMAAVTTAVGLGCGKEAIADGIESVRGVEGRFESVEAGQPFNVIVDYAHKPDALEKVLKAARRITEGRLITVFGCGGDRDKGKRPLMAAIAETLSDQVVVTSDNPRTENPQAILRDITAGLKDKRRYRVIEDRATAIREAVGMAGPGDTIIIAGKGHETYQILGSEKHHFDDREQARAALKENHGTGVK